MLSLDAVLVRFEACRATARAAHLALDLPGGLGAACPCGVYGSGPRGSAACVDLAALRHRALDEGWAAEAEEFLTRHGPTRAPEAAEGVDGPGRAAAARTGP